MKCFGDKSRTHHSKVVLLDEQELIQEIQDTTTGQDLLETVFSHLNLMETAYFGLRYLDPDNQTHWLDPAKKVVKQLKGTSPFTLYFSVKFYAADPCKLVEEITRYQFFLQVKQDILQGRLPITQELAAELGSYAVQSELGDYDPRRHSPGYVSEFRFVTTQSVPLESRIAEQHKKLMGQVPSKAEMCYLEKVKWLDMYGVDLHPVLGEDNIEYFLGLTPSGVIVLRNKAKVGNYFWPRISKVYFRGRFFMLRVRDKNNSENTYGFETPSKAACKHLWQCCVEHHAFFRLTQASGNTPQAIFSLGSKFSGRTEKEAVQEAKLQGSRTQPEFTRIPSRRYQRRIVEGAQDTPRVEDIEVKSETHSTLQLPTPVSSVSHMYRSSTFLGAGPRSDSPRSTRSAPQPAGQRGNYRGRGAGGASPRSVHSAATTLATTTTTTATTPTTGTPGYVSCRTSSVDSQSSVDSRGHRRQRRGRARSSDGESEASSKCSSRCHRHRHRHRHTSDDTDSHRHRRRRHRHKSGGSMVNSEGQWAQVQAGEAQVRGNTATVRDLSHKSGYQPSGVDTEADSHHHIHLHKKRHRKHRSRSRSPSEAKNSRIPDELRRHLNLDLQHCQGLSEAQLRQIPYTRVETAKTIKIKYTSPKTKRHKSPRRSKSNSSDRKATPPADGESPPPPYTPSPTSKTNTLPKSNTKESGEERNGVGGGDAQLSQQRVSQASMGILRVQSPDGLAAGEGQSQGGGDGPHQGRLLDDAGPGMTPIPPPVPPLPSSQGYGYSSTHKAVMVNGPSVKSLVTGGGANGTLSPLHHHPTIPSSLHHHHTTSSKIPDDGGGEGEMENGGGFGSMKNGERGSQFTAVLKPQSSPQSSVTSGISVGSSSTSTAIASDHLGFPNSIYNSYSATPEKVGEVDWRKAGMGMTNQAGRGVAGEVGRDKMSEAGKGMLGEASRGKMNEAGWEKGGRSELGRIMIPSGIPHNMPYLPSSGPIPKIVSGTLISENFSHFNGRSCAREPVNRMANGYFNGFDGNDYHDYVNEKVSGNVKAFDNGHVNGFVNGQNGSLADSIESDCKSSHNVSFSYDSLSQRNSKTNGINITMNKKIERNRLVGKKSENIKSKTKVSTDEIRTEL